MEGRKTLFATLGATLFVAGIALAGTAAAAIIDAPAKRNLTVEWVILGLAVVMIGGGAYVFAAALSDHLPLPGMRAIRRAAAEHALAQLILTISVNRGSDLIDAVKIPPPDVLKAWLGGTLDFISKTWGPKETVLIAGGVREISSALVPGGPPLMGPLNPFLVRLEDFLRRCHDIPLDSDHKKIDISEWEEMMFGPKTEGTVPDAPTP